MKQTFTTVKFCGMETQQFVPVQSETGVLASCASVRVTGARVEPVATAVIEVRVAPERTVEVKNYLPTFSHAETAVRPH